MSIGAKILVLVTEYNATVYLAITSPVDRFNYLIDLLNQHKIRAGDGEVSVLATALENKIYAA